MENLMDFDKNTCLVCKIDQPAYFRTIYRLTEHQNKTRYIKYLLFSNNVAFGRHGLLSTHFIALEEYV